MAQTQTSNISPQAPSPEALTAARSYPIGMPVEEYRVGLPLGLKIVFGLVGALGIVFLAISVPTVEREPLGALFGLVCILLGAAIFLAPVLLRSWIIVLGTEGFVRLHGKQATVARWEQITTIKRSRNRYYTLFMCWLTISHYNIRLGNGQKLALSSLFATIEKLGSHVEEMVIRYQGPQALAAFQNGMPVQFGSLTLSREGIKSGFQQIPWNEIMGLRVVNVIPTRSLGTGMGSEYLEIDRPRALLKAAQKTTRIHVGSLENLPTFLALMKQLSGGRL